MARTGSAAPIRRGVVKLWFLLDMVVVLAPPLYWAADGRTEPILGVPLALLYFLAVNLFVTASLVFAYLCDDRGRA